MTDEIREEKKEEETSEMSDDEFAEFIKKNKARMKTLLAKDDELLEFMTEKAKKAKNKAEETASNVKETVSGAFSAMTSTEVQKHIIGAGIELMLGIDAFIKSLPLSGKAAEFREKAQEARENANSVVCAKNPNCARKKSAEKAECNKIELE